MDRRTLILSGVAGIAQIGQHAQPRSTPAQILRETHVPALGGLVIPPKGDPIVSVFGRRRANLSPEVRADDIWLAGSVTQAMTAALYARLAEGNRANWRTRTPDLFPDLKTHPAWAEVAIEDFLQHRSGVSDAPVTTETFLATATVDERPLDVQRTEVARLILSEPPQGTPGQYAFANANYVLVGAAIERITRGLWERAISGEMFTPLGMTSAGFGAPVGSGAAWGHQMLGARAVPIAPTGIADDPPVFGPSARVHLSLADYAAFLRVFVGQSDYLSVDSLRRIADPRTASGDGQGLGWSVLGNRAWAKGPVLSQQSSGGFWAANIAVAPARGVAVAAVCNAGGGPAAIATERFMLTLIQPYAQAA
jgi:CubicO group peptidase (beta-lactamase class C family)